MTVPILHTKLHVPAPQLKLVPRPRLINLLRDSATRRLILISAPAGYGKTILLSDFAHSSPLPIGWFQIDAGDNDVVTFLEYLIAALQELRKDFGRTTLSLMWGMETSGFQVERILNSLVNEMEEIPEDFALILDDYHFISSPTIHAALGHLLFHLPPRAHLIISSRTDPPLPLARLRAHGELVEVRVPELRFTTGEAVLFFKQTVEWDISPEDVEALEDKTEGWVIGLKLAASSMAGLRDKEAFIQKFRGTNRYVFDYLVEEVFNRQPPQVQDFMVRTAILDQMSTSLCDEVLGMGSSKDFLEGLDRGNLFTLPLDEERRWYRYHHLFSEFLQGQLERTYPEERARLCLRAGEWWRKGGNPSLAIEYFLKAEEEGYQRAGRLITEFFGDYICHGHSDTVARWLSQIPQEVIARDPYFLSAQANVLILNGRVREAKGICQRARDMFAALKDNFGQTRSLAQLAHIARSLGGYKEGAALCQEALDLLGSEHPKERAKVLMEQSGAWMMMGNNQSAKAVLEEALYVAEVSGDRPLLAVAAAVLSEASYVTGDYDQAMAMHRRVEELAEEEGTPDTPYIYTNSIVTVLCNLGRLDEALDFAQRNLEVKLKYQYKEELPYAYHQLANVYAGLGDWENSEKFYLKAIAAADEVGGEEFRRSVSTSLLALLYLRQGRIGEAIRLCESVLKRREEEGSALELGICRLILSSAYLTSGKLDEGLQGLSDVEVVFRRMGARYHLMSTHAHLARFHLSQGNREEAKRHMAFCLELADEGGYVQYFVSDFITPGMEMLPLLIFSLEEGIRPWFARQVLVGVGKVNLDIIRRLSTHSSPRVSGVAKAALRELGEEPSELVSDRVISLIGKVWPSYPALRALCLGDFRVYLDEEEITSWRTAKARDLLAYFITFRDRHLSLDQVLEALWPEVDPARGHALFRTNLYNLRQTLKAGKGKYILGTGGLYWLDREALWLDVEEFERAASTLSSGDKLDDGWLLARVELYRGDYLQNLYYDWCIAEQERLRRLYFKALQTLAAHSARKGNYLQAVNYCQRILALDPLREEVHCQLMDYYAHLGHRGSLVGQYQLLEKMLKQELDVEPRKETHQIYHHLLSTYFD